MKNPKKNLKNIKVFAFTIRRKKMLLLILLVALWVIIDYFDLHLLVGFGFFSKQFKPNPLEAVVAVFLLLTLLETWKTNKEVVRQTALTLRPYLRISWNSQHAGDNRRAQGITDSCIVVSNDGKGLMRSVNYEVKVDGKIVKMRNHSLIKAGDSTNMVCDDANNKAGQILGSRNDVNFESINNRIICENKIKIVGTYRDIEGGQYGFEIESDPTQQSWFKEKYIQKKIN